MGRGDKFADADGEGRKPSPDRLSNRNWSNICSVVIGMALARVSPSSLANLIPPLLRSFFRPFSSDFPIRNSRRRSSPVAAAFSLTSQSAHAAREGPVMEAPRPSSRYPWKPTCLYYTQGKCTMVRLLPSLLWWSLLVVLKTEWFPIIYLGVY